MAAFNRPTEATYTVHENISIDTQDNEDHTFCGIMFPVKCKDLLPLDHLVIKSVAVRGRLGPLTVWVSNPDQHQNGNDERMQQRVRLNPRYWTKLYEKNHDPSFRKYKDLELTTPLRLHPGETRVIYIHSSLPGDEAIVYDNSYYGQTSKRYEDSKLSIMTGRAHLSTTVFGQDPIWGWGNAWRDRREFVGRLKYGTVFKLWNPQVQPKFGHNFQDGARALFLSQRRWESPWSKLPDECIFYILNMCRWDWFDDGVDDMKQRRKREKAKLQQMKLEAAKREAEEAELAAANEAPTTGGEDRKQCARRCKTDRVFATDADSEDEDVEMQDTESHLKNSDDENINDVEDDDEDDDEGDDEDDDDEEWVESDEAEWSDNEDQYHNANFNAFIYRDVDSDTEDDNDNSELQTQANAHGQWMRRHYARLHILRALASVEDREILEF